MTTIVLNSRNSIEYIEKYVDLSHSKGIFKKEESDVLKRSFDVLLHDVTDKEIPKANALVFIENAFDRGQASGHYTKQDSSLAFNAFNYLKVNPNVPPVITKSEDPVKVGDTKLEEDVSDDEFDLSELSKPVPLKPTVI